MYIRLPSINPFPHQYRMFKAVSEGKHILAVIHRRAGKDIACLQMWILRALQRIGTHVYLFPLLQQARSVIWSGMDFDGKPFLSNIPECLIEYKNDARMEIRLVNGSRLVLAGSNNLTGLIGTNPVTIIYSEFALHNPNARQYLNPIIVQNKGIEIIQSTPRGKNHLWELFETVKDNPKYHIEHLGIDKTTKADGSPIITLEDIEDIKKRGMSDEMISQEFYCFPPETSITTNTGQIDISNIKPGDIVLSHSGRWRCVDGIISRYYEGKMIKITSYGCNEPIVCTPDHPIRIYNKEDSSYEWIMAKDITKKDYVCFPKISNGKSFNILSKELIIILAWYISEGSCSKTGIQFTISKNENEYKKEITECLTALGFDYKIYNTIHNATNIIVSSSKLSDFLSYSCGSKCYHKKIPFNLIIGYEELFFYTLIKGDGCVFENKSNKITYQYTTTSKSLAYQFQILGNSIGYKMSMNKIIPSNTETFIQGRKINSLAIKYDIRGTKPNTYEQKQNTPIRKAKYGVVGIVKNIEEIDYSGLVYNLNVAVDHTYIANGRIVHNCDFTTGNQGAYFTREMHDIDIEGRILPLKANPNLPLHTVWDLGGTDATAGWLFQVEGQYIHLLGLVHDTGYGLKHFLDWADNLRRQWGCQWGNHFGPHDIAQKHQGWEQAESRLMQARKAGWFFQLTPKLSLEDGIEALRYMLPKVKINVTECSLGIRALREYQREYDEVNACFAQKPLHNWASHIVDSLRYLSINYRRLYDIPMQPVKYEVGF